MKKVHDCVKGVSMPSLSVVCDVVCAVVNVVLEVVVVVICCCCDVVVHGELLWY